VKRPLPFLLVFLLAGRPARAAEPSPPAELAAFSRAVPAYFAKLEEFVATEKITQDVMRETNQTVLRHQVLLSDFQVAHLGEDADALWEFRFIRSVDGKALDADRQIQDFFRLRQPSAAAERRSIVALARDHSFPGCYWHNLTLTLLAFGPGILEDFDWTRKGRRFAFRQVRGLGIPEDLFDPASARHYPSGTLQLAADGVSPARLDLEWTSRESRLRVTMDFSPPAAAGEIALPRRYVAVHERLSSGALLDRTVFDYSGFRRFTVTTGQMDSEPPR
jgi:hypothetical protein